MKFSVTVDYLGDDRVKFVLKKALNVHRLMKLRK